MVTIRPFSPNTTPVPSRSAPRLSAVRASCTALMESFTTPSRGTPSARSSGTATWAARQAESAAVKKETVTVGVRVERQLSCPFEHARPPNGRRQASCYSLSAACAQPPTGGQQESNSTASAALHASAVAPASGDLLHPL